MFDFPNLDPAYIYKREGTENDPYMPVIDVNNVRNKLVVMKEIPQFEEKVKAFMGEQELTEVPIGNDELSETEFSVDYTTGVAMFHASLNSKLVRMEYLGTGYVSFPASRIWMTGQSNDPVESLEQVLDRVEEGVEVLDSMSDLKFVGDYDEESEYKKWNFVFYKNKTYVALQTVSGEAPENSSKWEIISSGVGFMGVYDSSKTYNAGDIVAGADLKNIYFSKKSDHSEAVDNNEYWDLMITLDDVESRVDSKIEEIDQVLSDVDSNESDRVDSEIARNTQLDESLDSFEERFEELAESEDARVLKEEERISYENERRISETSRRESENARESAEENRVSAEEEREQTIENLNSRLQDEINEAVNTLENANSMLEDMKSQVVDALNNLRDENDEFEDEMKNVFNFTYAGEFDLELFYYRNNVVTDDGSAYIALADTEGIDVSDEESWKVFARRGMDNLDVTIEGVEPDETGDFSLDYLNVVRTEEFEEFKDDTLKDMGDLESLRTLHRDDLVSAINELKGRIDDIIEIMPKD